MAKEKTDLIRIMGKDKTKWSEYCKALGTSSPKLFNKVMNSQNLNLDKKILEELQKKEMQLKRKLNI